MPWIGDVEDAKSIDDLITPASVTGKSIPDFENLDLKIASGLGKIRDNLPQQKAKLNQRRGHFRADRLL